ncbi:transforming acidic coiled-coil-containing protein 3-like [Myxocyprinus asiaticus]|uniref:transforming acidic coiled-coil-containing protein 3-like n=1 Tax=Myxocyprinus asiaticus TaxID=70543 RepID=UPI00222361C7|nr:transforming acidic coiled-coil-containing protein 3-like [Myxocyprinus asiaticus]
MSSVAVKENQGVCAVRKNSSSEDPCDIFSLEQPTGRPSILRQSQADNISKTVNRGAKVCFQTPRRDPVTKRIMSPSRTSRITSQKNNTNALETHTSSFTDQAVNSTSTTPINMQSNKDSYTDEDMPLQSKGAYTLDLDNLDAINPFQESYKMANSPPKSLLAHSPPKSLLANSPPKSSVSHVTYELLELDKTAAPVSAPEDDEKVPEVTKTALDETLPFSPSVENALAECSVNISSAEATVIIKTENIEKIATDTEESDIMEPLQVYPQIRVMDNHPEAQDLPLPRAGSYNLDFDNLDLLDPFQTGGSKIPNSPLLCKTLAILNPPLSSQEVKLEPEMLVQAPPTSPDVPAPSQESSTGAPSQESSTGAPSQESSTGAPSQESSIVTGGSSSASPPKENQMLLEFNFDDGAEVMRKPPPKRLGVKRPTGAKKVPKKTNAAVTEKEPEPKQVSPNNLEQTEPLDIPAAKGSYPFDFDKFDDPDFNPFGTKAKMGNSPPCDIQTSPVLTQTAIPVQQPEAPAQDEQLECRSPQAASENVKIAETERSVTVQQAEDVVSFTASHTNLHHSPAPQEPEVTVTPEPRPDLQNQTCDFGIPSEDEFVHGALFMPGGDFDGQIDYLEQFGSSTFKESALRKQSLYLKFDPLLKDSPKKTAMESGNSGFSMPRPSLAIRMMEAAKSEGKQKSQCDSMKLLYDLHPPTVDNVVPDPTVLDLLVPTFKQPLKTEDSIIEVLKYSQRDMDAALQKADRQAEERQQELKAQIEAVQLENQHMLFIVSEFEATITQLTDEHKQKEDLAKIELERVLQEKDQLAKDLNDLEQSFSSIVKRLDRCKEVIEGFKKNEETLKQYAQNCMDRLQKEEKRYQALKAHAEEKLDQANKVIAEVRTKQGAEVATLQIQLKREQLKVQSLEKDLEQKAKEVKDVTELCDELLHKVQKHGF